MPSITLEKNESLKVTVPENLTIHVNKKCILVQMENSVHVHPVDDIYSITIEGSGTKTYDNRYILIRKRSNQSGFGTGYDIKTGPFSEKVYKFIIQNLYDLEYD